jgi:hypothetical protein
MSLRSKPLMRLRPTKLCLALMLAARRSGPRRQCRYLICRYAPNRSCSLDFYEAMFCPDAGGSAIGASPPMSLLNMSLRSKPLLQCRSCEPCFALMLAAPNSVMSLRSKPLLRLRPTRLCRALMWRLGDSDLPPHHAKTARVGGPGPRRLSVPVIASLQTAFAFQLSSGLAAFLHCGSARKSAAPLSSPVAECLCHIPLMPSGKPSIISQAEQPRYGDTESGPARDAAGNPAKNAKSRTA